MSRNIINFRRFFNWLLGLFNKSKEEASFTFKGATIEEKLRGDKNINCTIDFFMEKGAVSRILKNQSSCKKNMKTIRLNLFFAVKLSFPFDVDCSNSFLKDLSDDIKEWMFYSLSTNILDITGPELKKYSELIVNAKEAIKNLDLNLREKWHEKKLREKWHEKKLREKFKNKKKKETHIYFGVFYDGTKSDSFLCALKKNDDFAKQKNQHLRKYTFEEKTERPRHLDDLDLEPEVSCFYRGPSTYLGHSDTNAFKQERALH